MRAFLLAAGLSVLAIGAVAAQPSATDVYARHPAPVGHRQPSAADIEQARAARATSAFDLNELARRLEGNLRERLIICRGC